MAPPVAFIFSLVNFVLKRKKQQEETVTEKKIKWLEWLKESSTIRGIIVLAGLVGWKISPEGAEVAVGAAAAAIYAVYNLLRNDSVHTAVVRRRLCGTRPWRWRGLCRPLDHLALRALIELQRLSVLDLDSAAAPEGSGQLQQTCTRTATLLT